MTPVYITSRNLVRPHKVLDILDYGLWIKSDITARNRLYEDLLSLPIGSVGWTQDKRWLIKNGYV